MMLTIRLGEKSWYRNSKGLITDSQGGKVWIAVIKIAVRWTASHHHCFAMMIRYVYEGEKVLWRIMS